MSYTVMLLVTKMSVPIPAQNSTGGRRTFKSDGVKDHVLLIKIPSQQNTYLGGQRGKAGFPVRGVWAHLWWPSDAAKAHRERTWTCWIRRKAHTLRSRGYVRSGVCSKQCSPQSTPT